MSYSTFTKHTSCSAHEYAQITTTTEMSELAACSRPCLRVVFFIILLKVCVCVCKRTVHKLFIDELHFFRQAKCKMIIIISSDDKEGQFLFQRLSIALQRFDAILLHESFVSDVDPDHPAIFF